MTEQTEATGAELAPVQSAGGLTAIYDVHSPAEVVKVGAEQARVLAEVIEANAMYTVMGTRDVEIDMGGGRTATRKEVQKHINVEAWQFIGVMTGVTARLAWTRKVRDDASDEWRPPKLEWRQVERTNRKGETYTKNMQLPVEGEEGRGGWEARVELVTADERVIAAAEAECLWDEERWSTASSSAVRSMAQTRAESKAYRSVFGWIPKMAGYNPTPEEEMEGGGRRVERFDRVPDDLNEAQLLVWSQKAAVFHEPSGDKDVARDWWMAAMGVAGFERPGQVKNLPAEKAQLVLSHLQELAEDLEAPFETEPEAESSGAGHQPAEAEIEDAELVEEGEE